jgi:hypothetical protein
VVLERGPTGRGEQDPGGRIPLALRRSTDRRQARRGVSRREGNQTLRAEGAGAWNPRVNRILRARICRRGRNPRRAVSLACGPGKRIAEPYTSETSQPQVWCQGASCAGEPCRGRPQGGPETAKGMRGTRYPLPARGAEEVQVNVREVRLSRGNARPPSSRAWKALEGR